MSVNSIGTTFGTTTGTAASQVTSDQVTGAHHHHHGGGRSPFQAVSSLLGMSAQDIAGQVSSGKSLDDLAKEKGVSHDDLVSAIKAGMPDRMKNSANADQLAETIATQQGLPTQGPGGTPPSGPPPSGVAPSGPSPISSLNGIGRSSGILSGTLTGQQQDMLDSLSNLLGTDSNTLLDQLSSGTSLSDLVKDKGIDSSKLADVLQNGLLVDTTA